MSGPHRRSLIVAAGLSALTARSALARGDSAALCFNRYRQLINRHDFDLLADQVMADDAVFVFSDKRHEGLAAVRDSFNRTWAILPDEVYEMTDPVWIVQTRDSAACTFRYRYAGTMADGRALSGGGQGINLFRPTARGWRLVYEQLTPDTDPNG